MDRTMRKRHWEDVYATHDDQSVSWYQKEPSLSLELIRSIAPKFGGSIIDVGGGTSRLVDHLVAMRFDRVCVVDVSEIAIASNKARMGELGNNVRWIVADITDRPDLGVFDIWHDRAVLHFLVEESDRQSYVALVRGTVGPGGHVIIAVFADDGPTRCSGLEICRYSAVGLARVLGDGFVLKDTLREVHHTPSGLTQAFLYCVFQRV